VFVHIDGDRLVAVASVVQIESGWAVDSIAKCL
jgi:hypothetical protein